MKAIVAHDLGKIYSGGVTGLLRLNIDIEPGDIFGLLGPNGSGKSTAVRLLNGAIQPTSGNSSIDGLPSGDERVRGITATVSESAHLYEHLTVTENLRFFGRLYGMSHSDIQARGDALLEFLKVADRKESKVGSLSTGLIKRIQLVRALLHRPHILFLDEPTSGLDPESARQIVNLFHSLVEKENTTIFLCTHNLPLAEKICTRFGFLQAGRLVWTGSKDELFTKCMTQPIIRITTAGGTEEIVVPRDTNIDAEIHRMIESGITIHEVKRVQPSLEEAYFAIVGGKEHETIAC